jgi:hypothetical protein
MGLDFDMDLDLDNLPCSPLPVLIHECARSAAGAWPARGGGPGFGSQGKLAGIGAGGGDTICKCLPY